MTRTGQTRPAERALEKADRAFLALVRQDLAVTQPGRIVDAYMQCFPADSVVTIDRPRSSAGDAVPDPGNTPKLLAVDMDQLAGSLAFVTHNYWLGFERRQLAQTEPSQDRTHRRDRHAQLAGPG
jgi:hypothetical protein